MLYKHLNIKTEKDTEDRVYTATITTQSLDRDNEVLLSSGMDSSEFEKTGGTIFFNHNYNQPVGKSLFIKRGQKKWISQFKIADRPADYQGDFFPDFVASLIDQGIIKGVSVGYQTLQERIPTKKDINEFGKGVRNVVSKWKLLEYSIAPLQANAEALIKNFVDTKKITMEMAKMVLPTIEIELKEKNKDIVEIELQPKMTDIVKKKVEIQLLKKRGRLYI